MSDKHAVHHYQAMCTWRGSTGAGYETYDRSHELRAPPAPQTLTMSSDPVFRGDPQRLNPEQLLLMAAASCQMLSFLAIAARARL
ncbi:MAG: OsmC family protein, partial [Gammaproteobacteria bacterium]|nr:OsmC family protein [Gammaproteobacteria bacterium]